MIGHINITGALTVITLVNNNPGNVCLSRQNKASKGPVTHVLGAVSSSLISCLSLPPIMVPVLRAPQDVFGSVSSDYTRFERLSR